ncbi:MAG: hypothetical protein ACYC6W_10270 [Nitrosotalea sp.]
MQTSYFLMISVFVVITMGVILQFPIASSDSGYVTQLYAPRPDLTRMSLSLNGTFQHTSQNSTDLHLRFFDANNNSTINNVTFFINVTKDGKVLMHELFYTSTGWITIKFSPSNDIEKWVVHGTNEPTLGGRMSKNDTLYITGSAFTEGTYRIHVEVLSLFYVNELVDQSNPPTFDSWWSVDDKGNISKYNNDTIENSLKLGNHPIINKILSPLKQFKSGIAANDVKCEQDLQLVIKAEDNSPACVKSQTAQKLVERGWGWTMKSINSIKPSLPYRIIGLENDTGIVTLRNQTYYFETPYYSQDAYVSPVQISFHDVAFTLFPSGFRGGLPIPCNEQGSNQYYWADAKFTDSTHELLHILTDNPPCTNSIPNMFSNHTNPQAGLTFYDGKMKLLVSVDNQVSQKENTTLPASFEPCDTPYPQSNTGIAVLYMPANSIGKICIRYSNLNDTPEQIFGIRIFDPNNSYQNVTSITTWNDLGNNYAIPKGDSFTGVYWIKTGNQTGFYGLDLFCGGTPFAVGYDNNSKIVSSDFPFVGRTNSCPAMSYEYHVDSLTGIGVKHIPYP